MKKWRILIIAGFFLALGFILNATGVLQNVKNRFWKHLAPIDLVLDYTAAKVPPSIKGLFSIGIILRQNSNLISDNLMLQSKLARLSEVEYENEVLKKELGFLKEQKSADYVPASIIGHSVSGYVKTVVIDKGEDAGLEEGQAVVSQGFLIGTLSRVRQNNSEITFITDFNSLVPVVLQNSRGTGLLRGGLQGLIVENIPLNIETQKNEPVITSGLGGKIPTGIIVGNVDKVVSRQGEIFGKVSVNTPIDFSKIEVLLVVKKND